MLLMKRVAGESLTITVNGIVTTIRIVRVGSSVVELAIDAPPEVRIERDGETKPERAKGPNY